MSARTFDIKPAVREGVPVLVGLMGPSGAGKTYSALRLATGIQQVTGGDIYVIDTEARRALHYADMFKFNHVQFDPPHGSLDYLAAIEQCVKAGAKVIVVDSMSHEHSGVGGMIEYQERELDRLAGDDWAKRERVKMLAWQRPKAARRKLIDRILQINANFVFCFRAKETAKPVRKDGKTEIVQMGFMPIAGDEFLFEQTVNILLLPKSGGVPTWRSDQVGEKLMMKLPKQFEGIFEEQKPLDETIGHALAQWAKGSAKSPQPAVDRPAPFEAKTSPSADGAGEVDEALLQIEMALEEAAARGTAELKTEWQATHPSYQKRLQHKLAGWKETAAYADKGTEE
jgi:ABC-type dipeptide/oligopeptide/nickel transport system ATPase subunit